ncbi:Phage gp6-like head-tail connector protein [Gemmobacter aquatilis]|uniref:Phage gp6-like head-tail connector protein n=1 Tax=Gemmobacter aquatilis TaxID=933059 RepID=A0A1H8FCW2_9RHOB|nr:head-tail connector protein [Gemmobacter aquatilis]SEN29436.1 Phage gp6-like head-tail connector protein [Gemmobacter aquatilis]
MPVPDPLILLDEAKRHLRIDSDDDLLAVEGMVEAALEYLASIGVSLDYDLFENPMPAPLKQAALMLVARFYGRRGEDEPIGLDPVIDRLIAPYREIAL